MSKRDKNKVNTARRAKAKKPQSTQQRKVVKNRFGIPVRPGHCTACTAFDEHAAVTKRETIDTNGKTVAEILCPYCIERKWPWSDKPTIPYLAEWQYDADGNYIAFHGTAYCFVPDILRDGLHSKRESGMVYFSPYPLRAETYAKSWAVGMHACGVTNEIRASLLSFPFLEDEGYHREDFSDYAVLRSVAPSELSEESIDLSDLSPETSDYIGLLQSFASIVGFYLDPYREHAWYVKMYNRAAVRFDELRESVSPVVFFRARYVSVA